MPSEKESAHFDIEGGSPDGLGGDGDGDVSEGQPPLRDPGFFSTSVYTIDEWHQWHR